MGSEIASRMRQLNNAERLNYFENSERFRSQSRTKQEERNSLAYNFSSQMGAIDAEIERLDGLALQNAKIASSGEIEEKVMCDVYHTATEKLQVLEGKNVLDEANILSRKPLNG